MDKEEHCQQGISIIFNFLSYRKLKKERVEIIDFLKGTEIIFKVMLKYPNNAQIWEEGLSSITIISFYDEKYT